MDKILKISKLISTDIRSRANAEIIRAVVDGIEENVILDFRGVTFVSRSFTDELYNVMCEHKNIELVNTSDFVKSMIDAVTQGRKQKRIFVEEKSEIREFDDMKSLSSFLATI
jgi:hypothetical protein